MRKMTYIVKVTETIPIEGKDRIQIIKNDQNNYSVIGSKDIKIGDMMLYFEVDSILPVRPEFEFLRARCYKPSLNGFLIKNMKMSKIYSNGLLMKPEEIGITKYSLKEDFTEKLHIKKYEPEEDASPVENKLPAWKKNLKSFLMHYKATRWIGKKLFIKTKSFGEFPTWLIAKSDEDNIQNHKQWFDLYKHDLCYISEKMEGQSVTLLTNPKTNKFETYNRNSSANHNVQDFVREEGYDKILLSIKKKHYAVQGEFCSPTIQKGIYKNGKHFYVYFVKDLDEDRKLSCQEMIDFCRKYGFETVTILKKDITLDRFFESVNDLQEYTEHLWFNVGDEHYVIDDRREKKPKEAHRCEGIVVRNIDQSWSFKVKSNEYQLAGL